MAVLITGVSGFIGQRLAESLLSDGIDVTGLDFQNFNRELFQYENYSFIKESVTNESAFEKVTWAEYDYVCHLAASGVKAANRNWYSCVNVNVTGTANLLRSLLSAESKATKVPDFLFTRTFYEEHINQFTDLRQNPYIVTKAAAFSLVKNYIAAKRSNTVKIAKLFQVYGPSDNPNNVLNYTAAKLKQKENVYLGSGSGKRDWIYVDDAVLALKSCCLDDDKQDIEFDVGSGRLYTVRDMVETIADLLDAEKNLLNYDPALDRGDVGIAERARKIPDFWTNQIGIKEGLNKLISSIL